MEAYRPVTYRRRELNPELRDAVCASMRNAAEAHRQTTRGEAPTCHGYAGPVLTTLAGFTHQSELSRVLHADKIAASPRTIARLEAVARLVGFVGDIFADEHRETVEPVAAAQGAPL